MDIAGLIIDYETGELSVQGTLDLFSELIKNGMAWSLQGSYGRTANVLIENGFLDETGRMLKNVPN